MINYCITHKPIMELDNLCVSVLFAGSGKCPAHWQKDSSGDNISAKNPAYSEMTAQYWAWKNTFHEIDDNDLVSFCHYRRFFVRREDKGKVFTYDDLINYKPEEVVDIKVAQEGRVILPEPIYFKKKSLTVALKNILKNPKLYRDVYYRSTIATHYAKRHRLADLINSINIIECEEMRNSFKKYLFTKDNFSPCNIYVAKKRILANYFEAVFPWLAKTEEIINRSGRDVYQSRIQAFLAERFCSFYFHTYHDVHYQPICFIDA